MKLEARDKKVLIFGGAAAAVILLYALVLSPLTSDLARKRELIPKKEKDLAEMKAYLLQFDTTAHRLAASGMDADAITAELKRVLPQRSMADWMIALNEKSRYAGKK